MEADGLLGREAVSGASLPAECGLASEATACSRLARRFIWTFSADGSWQAVDARLRLVRCAVRAEDPYHAWSHDPNRVDRVPAALTNRVSPMLPRTHEDPRIAPVENVAGHVEAK
jgi:hypothetical protein